MTHPGYVGSSLAGPALVGGVAQAIGLHAALGIDVILCASVRRPGRLRPAPRHSGPGVTPVSESALKL